MEITLDTHSLIWYVDKKLNKKLSKKALEAIKKAEEAGIVYVSVIVLMETLHLIEKGRVKLSFLNAIINSIAKARENSIA
ncbi:MAG: PIN domain-containing protein, partial [bacterium]|nr:PIN domain-containing protein [bacterium]